MGSKTNEQNTGEIHAECEQMLAVLKDSSKCLATKLPMTCYLPDPVGLRISLHRTNGTYVVVLANTRASYARPGSPLIHRTETSSLT